MTEKTFPVVLKDGKTRQLKLDWAACCEIERKLGRSIFELAKDMVEGHLGFWALHVVFWAGLLHEGENLSIDAVGNLFEIGKFFDYSQVLVQAMNETFSFMVPGKKEATDSK